MSEVMDLVRRAEQLRHQVEGIGRELDQLSKDLVRLDSAAQLQPETKISCLALALSVAEDLGPGISSEDPHRSRTLLRPLA